MRLKMRTKMAGPEGTFLPNQEYNFDEPTASQLVEGGFALPVAQEAAPETASMKPAETATAPAADKAQKPAVPAAPAAGEATMEHQGFGKWKVTNAAGEVVAEDVKKQEALEILSELKKG